MFLTETATSQNWPCAVLFSASSPIFATPQVTLDTTNSNLPSRAAWSRPTWDGAAGVVLFPPAIRATARMPPPQSTMTTAATMSSTFPALPFFFGVAAGGYWTGGWPCCGGYGCCPCSAWLGSGGGSWVIRPDWRTVTRVSPSVRVNDVAITRSSDGPEKNWRLTGHVDVGSVTGSWPGVGAIRLYGPVRWRHAPRIDGPAEAATR